MRVIAADSCRIDAACCNLRCPYCTHLEAESVEMGAESIAEKLSNCESVYVGGAEPTVHGDLKEVLVYQYLSKPEWDKKVDYLRQPSYDEVAEAGKIAKKFTDKVIIVVGGRRFEVD